ncbi:hypothetical protein NDU88_007369 [Pleurodeles waltl]|uniref:Uncharacterized protein n=1 Tax=Pleurodeles waltl TaxID=8319 RepID=A0AAV7QNT5_PLEWA|nr:hypothetical protein NDU88_007369 [Pleurodeles waltl]
MDLRHGDLRPLYMLSKSSWHLNLNWQGNPPPAWCTPKPFIVQQAGGTEHPPQGPEGAWSRFMFPAMQVRPPRAPRAPVQGTLPHGGLGPDGASEHDLAGEASPCQPSDPEAP